MPAPSEEKDGKGVAMFKKRIYEILEVTDPEDRASKIFESFILSLIALNVAALITETVKPVYSAAPQATRTEGAFCLRLFGCGIGAMGGAHQSISFRRT